LWLRNINEKQLLIMFSGLMDTMLKRAAEKKVGQHPLVHTYIHTLDRHVLQDSKKPKLITREIVFLGMSMDSMAALKSCR
jgi:hypothetical protein